MPMTLPKPSQPPRKGRGNENMVYIISPFHNEANTIKNFINKLKEYCSTFRHEIIFVNDKSTDNSQEYLFDVTVFKNKFDGGKGSALKVGYILAEERFKMKDDDLIVFIDSDGQIDPKEITTFMRLMALYDADIVIGNKRHLYSNIKYTPMREFVSGGYNLIIRKLFGLSLRDTQCGLKIFKRYALNSVIEKVNIKRYAFDLELMVALRDSDFRIVDAPVFIGNQLNSGSVNLYNIIQTAIDTLKIWVKRQKGYYRNG